MRYLAVGFILCLPFVAFAENVSDCNPALVMSTYNRLDTSHTDWRVASLVTEKEWDEINKEFHGHAVIYGIPMGSDYQDYHNRVIDKLNSYNESLTQDELTNVAWTGLDPNGASAYVECLKASHQDQGLSVYVTNATKDEVSLRVTWRPTGVEPKTATLDWTWNADGKTKLPKTVMPGNKPVVLPRPKKQQILTAEFAGHEATLVITPYPPPPTKAETTYRSCVETYESRAADGWGSNWSAPVLFCTPDKPEGWQIAKLVDFSTTDGGSGRTCTYYGQCTGSESDSPKRICRTLTVQGHNEKDNHSNGHGWLVGRMIVEWKQPVKGGEDPTKSCHTDKQIVRELGSGDKLDAGN
jgi:hypothetical protein